MFQGSAVHSRQVSPSDEMSERDQAQVQSFIQSSRDKKAILPVLSTATDMGQYPPLSAVSDPKLLTETGPSFPTSSDRGRSALQPAACAQDRQDTTSAELVGKRKKKTINTIKTITSMLHDRGFVLPSAKPSSWHSVQSFLDEIDRLNPSASHMVTLKRPRYNDQQKKRRHKNSKKRKEEKMATMNSDT